MKQFWNQLPVWGKAIFLAVLAFGLYRAGRWVIRQWNTKGQKQELNDNTTNIQNLQQQGLVASYSGGQYSTWTNQLKEAFSGCGTSNGVWRNVFSKMKNDLDVALLIDAYGVRTYDQCNWEGDFGDFTGSLSEALVNELSSSELQEVNKLLESNKVNFRF